MASKLLILLIFISAPLFSQSVDLTEAGDNTLYYQAKYGLQPTNLYSTSYRPTNADIWLDLSAVTASDIPNSDDALATIPNSGTAGAIVSQATVGARPYWKTSFGQLMEPSIPGSYDLQDSWYRNRVKAFRMEPSRHMNITPISNDPTYLEGFIVVAATANTTFFAHRSEATRLIQVGCAGGKYVLQLRSSGNTLVTLTSTNDSNRGAVDIIYFRFNKAGNSHAISVNGETEVTNTTNFGAQTFTSTIQTLGAWTTDGGSSYIGHTIGNIYEFVLKTSAFTAQDKADCLQYLRMKYSDFDLSPVETYTPKSNIQIIRPGDNVKSIIEAAANNTHIKLTPGLHTITQTISVSQSDLNIEIQNGATLKLADNSYPDYISEIVTNQHEGNPMTGITLSGTYTGSIAKHIWIVTDGTGSPNTFKWTVGPDTGFPPSSYTNNNVPMSTSPTLLQDGLSVTFASTTGHSLNSGCILAIGGYYSVFEVGTGTHVNYIEKVKIFGGGTIDANGANQAEVSLHNTENANAIRFNGRLRNCGVYGLLLKNAERPFFAHGEHNGTYLAGGGTSGGASFDQEFTDIINCRVEGLINRASGILLGHPHHRGLLYYVRCMYNNVDTNNVGIEPNFKLRYYVVTANTVRVRNSGIALIACWRRSDNGIVLYNIKSVSVGNPMTSSSAPSGWETPVNITFYNNN